MPSWLDTAAVLAALALAAAYLLRRRRAKPGCASCPSPGIDSNSNARDNLPKGG